MVDYRAWVGLETARLSTLGRGLSEQQWSAPSLCEGWRVADIYAHMTIACTFSAARVAGTALWRYRGNLDRFWLIEARRYADTMTKDELLDRYDRGRVAPIGLARVTPWRVVLGDNVIHEFDIRRSLGIDDPAPAELLVAVLRLCTRLITPQVPAAWRSRGLSLSATDVAWARELKDAPAVAGRAEDLILAVAGRPLGLASLSGEGAAILASRIMTATSNVGPMHRFRAILRA